MTVVGRSRSASGAGAVTLRSARAYVALQPAARPMPRWCKSTVSRQMNGYRWAGYRSIVPERRQIRRGTPRRPILLGVSIVWKGEVGRGSPSHIPMYPYGLAGQRDWWGRGRDGSARRLRWVIA